MRCRPPGLGRTITLFSALRLRKLSDMEVVGLKFSSMTTLKLTLKTFEQYYKHRKIPNGTLFAHIQLGHCLWYSMMRLTFQPLINTRLRGLYLLFVNSLSSVASGKLPIHPGSSWSISNS